MPTVNLQTNVPVDSVVTSDILKDASKTVARILGKPESVNSFWLLSGCFNLLFFDVCIYYLLSPGFCFCFFIGGQCM